MARVVPGGLRDKWERDMRACEAVFHEGLTDDDRVWVRHHLELAGAQVPALDRSWLSFDRIR